jgi:hypothetical protein
MRVSADIGGFYAGAGPCGYLATPGASVLGGAPTVSFI